MAHSPETAALEASAGPAPGVRRSFLRRRRRRGGGGAGIAYTIWLILPVVGSALIDLPRERRAGPMTWLGILTIIQIVLASGMFLAAGTYPRRLLRALLPLAALGAWACATLLWTEPAPDAWPTALAYLQLGMLVAAAGAVAALEPVRVREVLDRAVLAFDVIGLSIAGASIASHGLAIMTWPVHPRAIALAAIAPVSWHAAQWYDGRRAALIPVILWLSVAIASLSRTATGTLVAVLLLVLALRSLATPPSSERRATMWLLGVVAGAMLAAGGLPQFRERLFVEDRLELWAGVATSALRAPLVGQGLGSSESSPVLRYWYVQPPAVDPRPHPWHEYWWVHPHNELLRAFHDLGIPGALLLAAALGGWIGTLAAGWRRLRPNREEPSSRLVVGALLATAGLAMAMMTDNPIVYPFVVGPLAVLIGAGLGAVSRTADL